MRKCDLKKGQLGGGLSVMRREEEKKKKGVQVSMLGIYQVKSLMSSS